MNPWLCLHQHLDLIAIARATTASFPDYLPFPLPFPFSGFFYVTIIVNNSLWFRMVGKNKTKTEKFSLVTWSQHLYLYPISSVSISYSVFIFILAYLCLCPIPSMHCPRYLPLSLYILSHLSLGFHLLSLLSIFFTRSFIFSSCLLLF